MKNKCDKSGKFGESFDEISAWCDECPLWEKCRRKYYLVKGRTKKRNFKRAILKAWMNGKFDNLDTFYIGTRSHRYYFRIFLSWYNKQNFEI